MRFSNWEISGFDRDIAEDFYNNGVNPLVSVLLSSRGITDIHEVFSVIGKEPAVFCDPYLMADMDKAVWRIKEAVTENERIAIFGDYDVDGMTASVLLALWLDSQNAEYEIYIPDRLDEGYGLNTAALDTLKANSIKLVVTVDCGVTAIDEALYAKKIGLDLVITDHHECRDSLPEAFAVVDPKRPDCSYPFKSLAGVGVAFKLVCALESDYLSQEIFDKYSELVAVGTVADVMPVVGENRGLIRKGMSVLGLNPRAGLRSLLREVDISPDKVTASTIGFLLAPRLNAAGRMGQTRLSVDLLLTDDPLKADTLAIELCRLNNERRSLELEISEEATAMLPDEVPDEPIVLAHRDWYQGVTGIIAAKMAERYRLPVVIVSIDEDGTGRGSCRSFGSFPLYDALCTCKELLYNYGGHEKAAGITVAEENIGKLRKKLTAYYKKSMKSAPEPGLKLDFEVEKPKLLDIENIKALESLEPFGSGNPSPSLCITEAVIISIQSIGAGKHSKLLVEKNGKSFECIFFSARAEDLGVAKGMIVDIAFEPQINEFRGQSNVQLQLQDIKASNGAATL